jgi:hypothetical protein
LKGTTVKVIAKVSERTYLAEVSHDEIEKAFNKYYGKLEPLKVGETLDLGIGFDFSGKIEQACKAMVIANEAFSKAQSTMTAYALAVANKESQNANI